MVAHAFTPALGRQRQADLLSSRPLLIYKASSRTVGATHRNPVSKQNKEQANNKKETRAMQSRLILTSWSSSSLRLPNVGITILTTMSSFFYLELPNLPSVEPFLLPVTIALCPPILYSPLSIPLPFHVSSSLGRTHPFLPTPIRLLSSADLLPVQCLHP